jgi:hypothetical protein
MDSPINYTFISNPLVINTNALCTKLVGKTGYRTPFQRPEYGSIY